MTFKEYQFNASRTMANLGSMELDLSHMVEGMHSEYNELYDAIQNNDIVNIGEELADKFWYVANYFTLRNIDFEHLFNGTSNVELLLFNDYHVGIAYYTSKIQNLVKRFIAYKKPINENEEIEVLTQIASVIAIVAMTYQLHLSDILYRNIEKLKIRFPEKFNVNDALNRNLEQERKTLER